MERLKVAPFISIWYQNLYSYGNKRKHFQLSIIFLHALVAGITNYLALMSKNEITFLRMFGST